MLRRTIRFDIGSAGMGLWTLLVFILLSSVFTAPVCEAQNNLASGENNLGTTERRHFVTNVIQFRKLSGNDYLGGCDFHLTGVITLVHTNRNLVVVQDPTGAVALNFNLRNSSLQVGQIASLDGMNCYPYVVSFPDYPFRPSGWDIRTAFEAPADWGEYHLQRMRGFLHPPASGEYTFWIASDNSSELWLSTSEDPSRSRRIAFIPRYGWVDPREWSRLFSQRSEPILLEAGQSYYIEALQEQTTLADHLSVAWQGPAVKQSIVGGNYLTPWMGSRGSTPFTQTNGILREYWTNYSAGNLMPLTAPRSFESALTVDKVQVNILGQGTLPKADPIVLDQRLPPEDNYRRVEVEGRVKFAGVDGGVAFLELSDGQAQIQVRALHWTPELASGVRNLPVRVEGVSEGIYDRNGTLMPGLIWASAEGSISLVDPERTISGTNTLVAAASPAAVASTNTAMSGFYGTRGVVTFNDRVFGKDYLFVQEDTASVFVSLTNRQYQNQLKVGQWVDLGGALLPGKYLPVISPLVMAQLGWRSMPPPMTQPPQFPVPESCDGRWTEVEGIVHSVNSNGTISVLGKTGPISLWVGQTPSNYLTHYVDAKLRVRGVLSLTALDTPVLLIPSRSFVDVAEEAPEDPFQSQVCLIADLDRNAASDPSLLHRIRVIGEVTYRDGQSFVMQDQSGGIRVQNPGGRVVNIGEAADVVGFPAVGGPFRMLTEAMVRSASTSRHAEATELDLNEALSFKQNGMLVHVSANLLDQKTAGNSQILELQEQQRIFVATYSNDKSSLPVITPGSRLRIIGICDNGSVVASAAGKSGVGTASVGSLNILLRTPADVVVLSGPPWWTLIRTITLVGALLTVLAVALLWVHLLRRRLERQQAARLAFSRQILENQESERQRIAVNLHDSLGQNLLVIKNQARLALQPTEDESARQRRLNAISAITSQAIEEVRQITHDLRPYQLDRLGLTQAIRATVSRASEGSNISFATHVDDIDPVFGKEAEIHIYRVIQEAVNNVIKHSGATEAAVVVKNQTTFVSLSIRDNGCGFDTRAMDLSRSRDLGYGLSGITERVRILGGRLLIDSHPSHGTSLTVEIPVPVSKPSCGK